MYKLGHSECGSARQPASGDSILRNNEIADEIEEKRFQRLVFRKKSSYRFGTASFRNVALTLNVNLTVPLLRKKLVQKKKQGAGERPTCKALRYLSNTAGESTDSPEGYASATGASSVTMADIG
ncbi:unnamed protein product [Nesidiocoris tenuis]|uniref:Uncharacterized protein n=1 Tax=Nesidiocoris tenuis TaxID=355587 RepID=A0A6H5HF51_9HEMI|nr:unnamed protein product [Nesidiocoris tenuis]